MGNDDDLLANAIPIEDPDDQDSSSDPEGLAALDLMESGDDDDGENKIQSFDQRSAYQEKWKRPVTKSGQGASHVRTFVCKLRLDAIEHLDEQVNEWLDEHPEYEVKFVSTATGILTGKLKEEAIFMNVWV